MNAMVLLNGSFSSPITWVWVGAFLLVILGRIAMLHLYDLRRQKAYERFCPAHGYDYEASRTGAEASYGRLVEPFSEGYDHEWRHVISGQFNGHPFTTFEYCFTTGSGRSRTTHRMAVIHWEKADAHLPQFIMGPENFFQRLGWVGGNDIQFLNDPAFSKACALTGPDVEAVRALYTPAVRATLTPIRGQHLAGGGPDLFWWKDGDLPEPNQFEAYLTELDGVRRLFF
jgi:hypothetical protein